MPLYLWEGKLLVVGGELATAVDCCCEGDCVCCGSTNDARITVSAPGCSLDGFTDVVAPTSEDFWSWTFTGAYADDCTDELDYLEFILTCVDGEYQLQFNVNVTGTAGGFSCYATACTTTRNCYFEDGFILVFEMECCGCTLEITIEEIVTPP